MNLSDVLLILAMSNGREDALPTFKRGRGADGMLVTMTSNVVGDIRDAAAGEMLVTTGA